MKKIPIILFLFAFAIGCKTKQNSCCSSVEMSVIEWDDTVIYKANHWHYQEQNGEWCCIETDPDTAYICLRDTIYTKNLNNECIRTNR